MPNLANLPVADLQAGTANWSGQGYIDGLKMVWNSDTSISVTSGAAFIPALNKCLQSPSAITKSGLSLAASTWYHVYLYLNAGTPDIEIVTTAPAAPYNGTARAKTGDTSRRYIGSVLTDASGNVLNFVQYANSIRYQVVLGGVLRALGGGNATTITNVSLVNQLPVTAVSALLSIDNPPSTAQSLRIGNPIQTFLFATYSGTVVTADLVPDASLNMSYVFKAAPTSGGAFMDVLGYTYER